ncbi:MAG: alkaline shock response membrane anchor protein AmaP [Candidatus Firestonebacteria bacterium]
MQILRKLLMYISAIILLIFSIEGALAGFNETSNQWIKIFVNDVLTVIYTDLTLRIITLTLSIILLLFCVAFIVSSIKFRRRERTVILKSPYGEVKVSLGAIEDFIKMLKGKIKGVKEIRPKVYVRKAGLKIYVKVSLWSDSNVHEMTQDIQDAIKRHIQNTLGIEKVGDIRVFIEKILYRENKDSKEQFGGLVYH